MPSVIPELRQFLEQYLNDSVVLLSIGGSPSQTAFFVSEDGLLCTTHHFYEPVLCDSYVTVQWRGLEYRALYKADLSDTTSDVAFFQMLSRMESESLRTTPVPLYPHRLDNTDQGIPCVALGFAGMTDPYAPQRLRLFEGTLSWTAGYQTHPGHRLLPEFDTLDVTVAAGNSGAPILDLRRFRVVAYVRGRLGTPAQQGQPAASPIERMGRACPIPPVLLDMESLCDSWRDAGERLESEKRRFFRALRLPLPSDIVTSSDAIAAIEQQNRDVLSRLESAGVFHPTLLVPRATTKRILEFLASEEYPVAVVAGQSGTGKTTILADLCRRELPRFAIPFLVTCGELGVGDSLDGLPSHLHFDLDLESLIRRIASDGKRLAMILDGYNEWPAASGQHFCQILERVSAIAQQYPGSLAILVAAKSEFLREHLPELVFADAAASSPLPLHVIYRHVIQGDSDKEAGRSQRERLTIEVPTLHQSHLHDVSSEQRLMYEHYRRQGTVRTPAGEEIGICPLTTYEALPNSILTFIDRPLLLRQFMIRYHGQQAPTVGLRFSLYREIVVPDIAKFAPSWITRERVENLMANLARYLLHNGVQTATFRQLTNQPWFDAGTVELLLTHTFFLSRSKVSGSILGGTQIGFSSDWLFEYYLSLDIWEELLDGNEHRPQYLATLFDASGGTQADRLVGPLANVAELSLTRDHIMLRDILTAGAQAEQSPVSSAFIASFFELVRTQYGFAIPLPPEAFGAPASALDIFKGLRNTFSAGGLRRIMSYVAHLGDDGIDDALALLSFDQTLDGTLWESLGPAGLAELKTLRALMRFRINNEQDVRSALAELQQMDGGRLPDVARNRYMFVLGRCHQWFREYDAALNAYEKGSDGDDHYASMCRHQIAFIEFFEHSNYQRAAELLTTNTRSRGDAARNQSSIHLLATCLMELGQYRNAEDLIESQLRQRNRQGLGRARVLRTLAQLRLRTFERDAAIDTCRAAGELSRNATNRLVYAESLEAEASVLALHDGDLPQALSLMNDVMSIARERNHRPSLSWFLQTEAMVHALKGDADAMATALGSAASFGLNPNQERRTQLVRALCAHAVLGRSSPREDLEQLESEYRQAGQVWYAGIVALLRDSQAGRDVELHSLLPDGTNISGLRRSFLFRFVFPAEANVSEES
jgi:tetratricopeptide (TPR) repeat protein